MKEVVFAGKVTILHIKVAESEEEDTVKRIIVEIGEAVATDTAMAAIVTRHLSPISILQQTIPNQLR